MSASQLHIPRLLQADSPQETLYAFREVYPLEEVQAELWRCIQPRLLTACRELGPVEASQKAALYENLELLVSAVYHLPALLDNPDQNPQDSHE